MERALTANEIRSFEQRLRKLLDSYAERTGKVEDNTLRPSGDPEGQAEDEGLDDAALELESEVLATIDSLAYQVRDALQRVADGSFGRCEDCGASVGRLRLEHLPYAATCMACAREREAERGASQARRATGS